MAYTRSTARTRVTQRMDAVSSGRWDATAGGEIDNVLTHVVDREWRRLLTQAPGLRLAERTPTSSATTGKYTISDLDSGSNDTKQRLFRIQLFSVDDIAYEEVAAKDYLGYTTDSTVSQQYIFWREGDYISTLPSVVSKAASVWVTHLPQRVDTLAGDSSTITFPEGYEELYILESAAYLLAKGGEETQATAEFRTLADEIRRDMIDDLVRFSSRPLQKRYDDSALDWGGNM